MTTAKKLWIGIGALAVCSPLGVFLPGIFKAGSAWGEWGTDEIKEAAGYIPAGLQRLADIWRAPLPDYSFRGWEGKGVGYQSCAYVISAVVGIAVVVAVSMALGKVLSEKDAKTK